MQTDISTIEISSIIRDPAYRARLHSDPAVVAEYARLCAAGVALPPVTLMDVGLSKRRLINGWMSVEAHEANGATTVPAIVLSGTMEDAITAIVTANQTHGLRLTSADKRNAVLLVLQHFPNYSNGKIGDLCGVSSQTVANVRSKLSDASADGRVGKDGKSYKRSTADDKAAALLAERPAATADPGEMIDCPVVEIEPALVEEPTISQDAGERWRHYVAAKQRLDDVINADLRTLADAARGRILAPDQSRDIAQRYKSVVAFAGSICLSAQLASVA